MRRLFVFGGCAALCAAVLLVVGCTSKNNNPTNLPPNQASVGHATEVPTVTPVPSAEAIGTVVASPSAVAATGAQRLIEIATDDKYSQTSFTVKANQPIELTLTNNGQAIHNWHLLNAKDKDGKDILTPLLNPGQSATIDFTISQPGTYNFQCDVHPTEMKGTLTVQ